MQANITAIYGKDRTGSHSLLLHEEARKKKKKKKKKNKPSPLLGRLSLEA
jgi:hypothetical protein